MRRGRWLVKDTGGHWLKGALAGAAGGLAASWVMTQFFNAVGQAQSRAQELRARRADSEGNPARAAEQQHAIEQHREPQQAPAEPTTETAAAAIVQRMTGRELAERHKKVGGSVVHYGFGTIMGALYGALSELAPGATRGHGTVFGTALWAAADVVAVPMLGFSNPPLQVPPSVHAQGFAAHLVYGATTEAVRRVLRYGL